MQTFVLVMVCAALGSAQLGAQPVPRVQRMPVDSLPVSSRAGWAHIRIDAPIASNPLTAITIIVDSSFVWSVPRDSLDPTVVVQQGVLGALNVNDIRSIEVLKGAHALARGACPGTGLVVIATKAGHWRPPAGIATSRKRADCRFTRASD